MSNMINNVKNSSRRETDLHNISPASQYSSTVKDRSETDKEHKNIKSKANIK